VLARWAKWENDGELLTGTNALKAQISRYEAMPAQELKAKTKEIKGLIRSWKW
jgi:hypothetical protein